MSAENIWNSLRHCAYVSVCAYVCVGVCACVCVNKNMSFNCYITSSYYNLLQVIMS